MREQFNEAYPLEAWQVKANGEAVARAIQFQNLKREWEGFQRGFRAGAEAQREQDAKHFDGDPDGTYEARYIADLIRSAPISGDSHE